MNNLKWIYIIERSGTINELHVGEEKFKALMESWGRGDKIATTSMNGEPLGINAVDISKIVGEEGYKTYVETLAPNKNYIVKGVWYDKKEKRKVRVESWKQMKIDETKLLQEKKESDYLAEATKPNSSLQKKIKRVGDEMRASGVLPPKK